MIFLLQFGMIKNFEIFQRPTKVHEPVVFHNLLLLPIAINTVLFKPVERHSCNAIKLQLSW